MCNLNRVLTQNTLPPALLVPLPQIKQGASVTVPCFLHWQVRAVLDPAPLSLAGQGAKDGGGRGEGAVAAVPSPSLDGCPCVAVDVGKARCPGALGTFSQHCWGQGKSFLPQPCVSSMCWQLSQKGYGPPAVRYPWPDVFWLSGTAESPSWCSHCLSRHSLTRRKGSSAGRCRVQTFLSRQSSKAFEVS